MQRVEGVTNNGNMPYGDGDAIRIWFDAVVEDSGREAVPGNSSIYNRDAVDSLFSFSADLGQDYLGSWYLHGNSATSTDD